MQLLTTVLGDVECVCPCAQAQLEKSVFLEWIPLLHIQWTK